MASCDMQVPSLSQSVNLLAIFCLTQSSDL